MCGRFVGFREIDELKFHFPIDRADCRASASYNIAPSREVLAIASKEGENRLEKYHWGLVPYWAKDTAMGNRMINARSETVAVKPAFKQAFIKRRCLIPADGFYEWSGKKGRKQPVYITLPDERPFAFAGLWESWRPKEAEGPAYLSCTIITTAASSSIEAYHHRMPVVLLPRAYDAWLDPRNRKPDTLMALLQEAHQRKFSGRLVGPQVNRPGHDDPGNIQPLSQMDLFESEVQGSG